MSKRLMWWLVFLILGGTATAGYFLGYGRLKATPIPLPQAPQDGIKKRKPDGTQDLSSIPQEVVFRSGLPAEVALPWEHDAEFVHARDKIGAHRRLAAFRAVLAEPIASERHNIALAAQKLAGTVVPAGKVFSQNGALAPYSEAKGYRSGPNYVGGKVVLGTGGGVCKISTMLYNLAVLSDLPVVRRQFHSMIVPYVPPGQDATVSYTGGVDFKFHNDTQKPILVWGKMVDNTLYMALYGQKVPPKVEWKHVILSKTAASTVERQSPDLPPGERRVAFKGFDGYTVESSALITYPDGRTEIRKLGRSYYRQAPRIIEYGR